MQVRAKPTIHVTMTPETLAMADEMARDDAPTGAAPDRSRLIGLAVKCLWEQRGKSPTPGLTGNARPAKARKQ